MVIKLNKSEGECMPIILKGAGQWQAGLGDLFIAIPLQYGVHVFNFTRSTARSPVFQDRVVNAAQGEPRALRPELFDRLKALSSIEGLGSKASPSL